MAGIMADHNVEGHRVVLLRLWTSEAWRAVWESLQLEVESFERLGMPYDTSDHELWQLCQQREIILLSVRVSLGPRPFSWSRTSVCPMNWTGNAALRVTNGSWTTQRLRS